MAMARIDWCARIDKVGADKALDETKLDGDVRRVVGAIFRHYAKTRGEKTKDGKDARCLLNWQTASVNRTLKLSSDFAEWRALVKEAQQGGYVTTLWRGGKPFGIIPANGKARESDFDAESLCRGL